MAVQKNASKAPGKAGEKNGDKVSGKSPEKPPAKAMKPSSKFDSLKNLVFGGAAQAVKKAGLSAKREGKPAKEGNKTEKKGDSSKLNDESSGRLAAGSKSAENLKQAGTAKKNIKDLPSAASKASSSGKSAEGKRKSSSVPAMQLPNGISHTLNGLKKASSSLGAGRISSEAVESVCREVACEGLATTGGYCRLHYIKNWKKIKRKEVILREKKLNQYIEELVAKYPDKYIEAIQQDLASDKDFAKVIYDLDLDEGADDFDMEGGESVDSLIDSIKRDFDDDSDAF